MSLLEERLAAETPKRDDIGMDMSFVGFRNGRIKQALQFALSDFRWIEQRRHIASMAVQAATKRLLVERTAEAAVQFEAAMEHYHGIGSRVGLAVSHLETVLADLAEGEAEEKRRSEAYTRSIVDGTKRIARPKPQPVEMHDRLKDIMARMPTRAPEGQSA